jgi:hypothetical protein
LNMTSKSDVDQLAALPAEIIEERINLARLRVETRAHRAADEHRDLSEAEGELCADDVRELSALSDALQLRSRNAERRENAGGEIQSMIDGRADTRSQPAFQPGLLVSDRNLEAHATALRDGRSYGAIESRSRVTAGADLGSAGAWAPGTPNEPLHLIAFAGIPVSELTGKTAQVPVYSAPAAAAGVDEGADHGEYDAVDPANLTALRYGRWSEVSALANVVDDLSGLNRMHAWGISRDLDAMAVAAIQTAAGSAAVLTALEQQVRGAILAIAANTYTDPASLVVLGRPDAVAALTGTMPTNGGDVGSVSVRFNGARIYPTNSAAANRLVVFAPGSFRTFQTRLQSASAIDPASGANKFGSWIHGTGVAAQIPGSALAVSTVAP